MDVDPRCPDCGVTMERTKIQTGDGFGLSVKTGEKAGGLLGSLGVNKSLDVSPRMCPECGLVRLYAEE
ncbi:hypothetical protein [Halorussus amylolyticus]|uniref:hypothetical protein n=1 Tax=Halorussus amylolyticus TaxID=1126242 RepID=UPI00138F91F0|nr:hypothetical protein [Halorussus amylolyticus]